MSQRATPRPVVGIDLGTTHSLVAVCDQDGRPKILRNALGETLTPSAVAIDESGQVLVGRPALDRAILAPERTATSFKRDMGMDVPYLLGDHSSTPSELSSLVLRALCEDAREQLGRLPEAAVISVPAYFDERQRRATRDAAELAGLEVLRLINEPTAAAIAYGLGALDQEQVAIVLDLGGGTFDVTVVELIEGVIEIQASAGDTRLGGDDFTDALARYVIEGLAPEAFFRPDDVGWRRLREACEVAKRNLSREAAVRVHIESLPIGGFTRRIDRVLEREEADQLWQPLLDRMRAPIRRALRDAGKEASAIDKVLLVGGASRMPCFTRLATETFGRPPVGGLLVDEIVARGAALQAALTAGAEGVEDLIVTDVAAFSLGIEVVGSVAGGLIGGVYSPVLERGTVLPSSRRRVYGTVRDDQPAILLRVYQGEHPTCSQNLLLGELPLDGIPAGPAGQPVDVRFSYDLSGVLEVEASMHGMEPKSIVLEQATGRLGPEELDRARAQLDALKFHPREALPNTAALTRAETLYVELRGEPRDALGLVINAFKATLETGTTEDIEAARRALLDAVRGADRQHPV